MDLYILDKSLTPIDIIDLYESIIWTKRYYTYGDFELYVPASVKMLNVLTQGNYIKRNDDDRVMIIKTIQVQTDVELGNYLIVKGKSAEYLLNSRIVWRQTTINGNAEIGARQLVTENIISPTIEHRKIENFILGERRNFTEKIEMQSTGDKIDEAITNICTTNGWGYKVTLDKNNNFVFDLYKGENKGVIFSPEYDNLINSDYLNDITTFANCALIAGEGEGTARKTATIGEASGIDRFETFVDARDISSNDGEISSTEYNNLLLQRGDEKLKEMQPVTAFEGEVAYNLTYKYKDDYDIGDVVNVVNEYGIKGTARIIEIIESDGTDGYKVIPTFDEWSV